MQENIQNIFGAVNIQLVQNISKILDVLLIAVSIANFLNEDEASIIFKLKQAIQK